MRSLHKALKNHFIPHAGNGHKPYLLRYKTAIACFSIAIFVELLFLAQVYHVLDNREFTASVLPGVLTNLTNNERIQNNVSPLIENESLKKAAQMKADDMARRGYFAHTSPDGLSPWYWLDQVGYKYLYAGENLAVNFFESEDVARAWMASPSHRANMVRKEYTEIGIAVSSGTYEGHSAVFVAQFFGKPLKKVQPKKIEPILTDANPKIESTNSTKVIDTNINTEVSNKTLAQTPAPVMTKVLGEEVVSQIMTSPRKSTNFSLNFLLLFVSLLLLVFLIKSDIKHPSVIIRTLGLILFISMLLYVNFYIVNDHTFVPKDDSPNAIFNPI